MSARAACAKVYGADEALCTGTFAGVLPVGSVDGRALGAAGAGRAGPMVERLAALYRAAVAQEAARGRAVALD